MTSLIAAAVLFIAIHLLVSGTRLRDTLVSALGEKVYMALFSIASLALIVWLVMSYNDAVTSAENVIYWQAPAGLMHSICVGEASEDISEVRAELDERARRGAPVSYAWPDGNLAPAGDSAQGLIWIRDSRGNSLPRWDAYLVRDDQGRWWIERFTSR